MKILKNNPQEFRVEKIGCSKRIVTAFYGLTAKDFELIEAIAIQHKATYPEIIQNAIEILIKKYEWKTKEIYEVVGSKKTKRYFTSTRLRDALQQNSWNPNDKLRLFREGLSILEQSPEKIKIEGIGIKEEKTTVTLYLQDSDLLKIDRLVASTEGLHSDAVIVRNAIEALIEKYNWKKYKKPQDWVESPLSVTAFSKGANPNAKASNRKKIPLSINAPPAIAEYLRSLTKTERSQRYLKSSYTATEFFRDAIDNCDWKNLQPLSSIEKFGKTKVITTNIYLDQRETMENFLKSRPQFHNLTDVCLAILLQQIKRKTSQKQLMTN
ncbi:hypothetical protein IQ264_27410 [Phormidium sp. LEGE 05292]|nr:hypothetical protein [Phormidium sp. LEGE 05292]